MTFIPFPTAIAVSPDGLAADAFGRARTSSLTTVLEIKHDLDKNDLQESEILANGATSTHLVAESAILLTATSAVGSSAARASRVRAIYQPGKSLLFLGTGVLDPGGANSATCRTRLGYFDADDGFYFTFLNNTLSIVKRSSVSGSVVETSVAETEFNAPGAAALVLDLTKAQIFFIDLAWLGVGSVRCGVFISGRPVLLHTFHHANVAPTAYIRSASLTPRYEVSGGAGSVKMICACVASEGGDHSPLSRNYSFDFGTTSRAANTTLSPIAAMRLVSFSKINVFASKLILVALGTRDLFFEILIYRSVADHSSVVNGSFVTADGGNVQLNNSCTTLLTRVGAEKVASGYRDGASPGSFDLTERALNRVLSCDISGVSDLLVLNIASIANTDNVLLAGAWRELF